MEKTRVMVIGLGGIAQIAHLPILAKMDSVEIAAVCDVDKSKSKVIAQRYNIKNYYSDFDKMLNDVEAECIIITSPTSMHKEHCMKSVSRGLDVLVEKPLARTFNEANDIVEAAKKSKKNHTQKLFLVLVLHAITLMGLSFLSTNGQLLLRILIIHMGNLI